MINRITSTFFSALPSLLFFIWFLFFSGSRHEDYFWSTYLIVLSVLLGSSIVLGFAVPSLFQVIRIRQPWIWILTAGTVAMLLALLVLTALNATPLCVGQDNGDGNNDFGMCMAYVVLDAVIFAPVFLFLQTVCAPIGHWVMKMIQRNVTSQTVKEI